MNTPSSSATALPGAPGLDLAALAADNLTPVLGRYFERSWSRGQGHRLYDTAGRAYLDFANGIAVSALGHGNPRVTAAIHAQVDRLIAPMAAMGYAEPTVRLAHELAATLPDPIDTIFFMNSGTEAIEASLKLARRVTGRPGIVAFRGAFHGRTLGSVSITSSNPNYRQGYEPLLPSVYISQFPSVYRDFGGDEERAVAVAFRHLRDLFHSTISPDEVAAIVVEPVQGEGGYIPAPPAFLQILRRVCDRHGILLVADEAQSGYGRTGKMWGFEHAGIVPDVVCIAKAIANGLPLSALASSRALQERWGRGAHGGTFGGNPVSCAAGLAVLEEIRERDLVANAAARGAELSAGLREIAAEDGRIGDVRGPGLMIGVEFVKDHTTREPDGATCVAVLQRCADEGLLLLLCGVEHNVIRWIAPLDVTLDEIGRHWGSSVGSSPRRPQKIRLGAETGARRMSAGRAGAGREHPAPAAPARGESIRRRQHPGPESRVLCRPACAGPWSGGPAGVPGEERHHVLEAEAPVTTRADPEEGQLAAIAEALHGVHMEVEHLRHLARGEQRSEVADGHAGVPRLTGSRGAGGVW